MNYDKARGILLATGVALFGLIALTAFVRDVDGVEVVAALMYAPILAALLSFGSTAGLVMGVLAAGVYVGLRLPAIELVGFAPIAGTLMSRVLGYIAFGALGGWAADQIRGALDRYQLIDEVDESSGLGNSRSVVNALARESSRAKRYASPFSVVTTSFGDLIGERLNGRMSVNSRRSDVVLTDIRGSYDIQAYYGVVKIFSDDDLLDLKIDAEKADVFLYASNPAIFGYDLTSKQGKINLPKSFDVKEVQNTQVLKQVEVRPMEQAYYQNITIRVSFGNITVAKKQ